MGHIFVYDIASRELKEILEGAGKISFRPVANTIEGSSMREDEMQNLTYEISVRKVVAAEFQSLDGGME